MSLPESPNRPVEGVAIIGIADGSPAQSYGFVRGDIILSVNDQKIAKPSDLERVANGGGRAWQVTIRRGNQQISAMFRG